VIAASTQSRFERLSGVEVKCRRHTGVVAQAANRLEHRAKTILFIDEIHQFNKAQQDVLLPDVEADCCAWWRDHTQPVFLCQ
jgi:putative ATPase